MPLKKVLFFYVNFDLFAVMDTSETGVQKPDSVAAKM